MTSRDKKTTTPGICRECGCTDLNCLGCIERTGEPCHWVEPDLCSACAPIAEPGRKKSDNKQKSAAKPSRVRRVLISGNNEALINFAALAGLFANAITRREQTVFYTILSGDWDRLLKAVRLSGATAQEIVIEAGEETYIRVAGEGPGWQPRIKPTKTKRPGRTSTSGPTK